MTLADEMTSELQAAQWSLETIRQAIHEQVKVYRETLVEGDPSIPDGTNVEEYNVIDQQYVTVDDAEDGWLPPEVEGRTRGVSWIAKRMSSDGDEATYLVEQKQ